MASSTTFSVISLGTLATTLDPTEGNTIAENGSALVGTTFNTFTNDSLVTWSPSTTNNYASTYDSLGYTTTYNQDGNYGYDAFQITDADGNVTTHYFDAMVEYSATVTYGDGTTATGTVLIGQATDGSAYVLPPSSYSPTAILDGNIQSIELTGMNATYGPNSSGLHAIRAELPNIITVPCMARGTLIETDHGAVAIEDLAEGDLVMTRDNGLQSIRWIGSRMMSSELLAKNDKLRPIRIRRHALGTNLPNADLLVSPQHRVLVRSAIAQKMFGTDEVLVAAKQLCLVDGIDIADDVDEVEYFHMLFDRHEVVISNGAETESLYTGTEALKSLGQAAVEEIFTIFPELKDRDYPPVSARPLATGRMGRKLAVRHAQNHKALVS